MSLLTISFAYLRSRLLGTILVATLLALGIATITVLMLVTAQLEERMQRDARGIDLVAGAKGSPLQIILSAIYHLDVPTGNISLARANEIARHRLVRRAIPLALGDSFHGFRIVGTNTDYPALYGAGLAGGTWWKTPLEAVLGSEVAAQTGLGPGATFAGAHGLGEGGGEHGDARYKVVGVLAPTGSVIDRVVLTGIESVWFVHDEHHGLAAEQYQPDPSKREVTALLIQYASPLAATTLPRYINNNSELQSASPAYETARLFSIVGVGVEVLRGFALVLILGAGLSVFVALYHALEERRYDLAIMRTLGASARRVMALLLCEGLLLVGIGTVAGMALGHALTSVLGAVLRQGQQVAVTGWTFLPQELWLLALAGGVGLLAALVPAWRAYRTDIAATLASG
jgi:putative ABC transport system permease protein